MPILNYHSVEAMPERSTAGTPGLLSNIADALLLSEIARRMGDHRLPPGVHRFRSTDEARRQREAWTRVER